MNRSLHRFAVFTACATLCLIVAGALVTSHEAGLAVPDWPLSYGSLTPPWVGNIRYEHGHRLVAGFILVLTVVLAVWLRRREPRAWVRRLGYAALGAVLAQAVLGGITVLFFLPIPVSVGHACLAQIFFCLTVTLALVTGPAWQSAGPPDLRAAASAFPLPMVTAGAIFLQLVMGAALRHKGFGIAPHLIGAAVITLLVMLTLYQVIVRYSNQPALLGPVAVLAGLLFVQLLLGVASYAAREITRDAPQPLPLMIWTTVPHVATGAMTLAASVWLALSSAYSLLSPSRDRKGAVPVPA